MHCPFLVGPFWARVNFVVPKLYSGLKAGRGKRTTVALWPCKVLFVVVTKNLHAAVDNSQGACHVGFVACQLLIFGLIRPVVLLLVLGDSLVNFLEYEVLVLICGLSALVIC